MRRDQTQAFEAVFERIGWSAKSRTAYVAIDMGERLPKPDEATVLGAEFGWPPDPEVNDDLQDATLASALLALTGELRASRLERESTEARLRAVEAELESLRAQPTGGGSPGLSVPLGSTGSDPS